MRKKPHHRRQRYDSLSKMRWAAPWPLLLAAVWIAACSSDSNDSHAFPQDAATLDGSVDGNENTPDASQDSTVDAPESSPDASPDAFTDAFTDASPDAAPDVDLDVTDASSETPSWIVDGKATCPELVSFVNTDKSASDVLQNCIDRTPKGMSLALEPGRYSIGTQLRIDIEIGLETAGREGSEACSADAGHGCAELFALPALDARFGMLLAKGKVRIDHIVFHGNRQGRANTHAHEMCSTLQDNAYGYNATLGCSNCQMTDSVSMYALCGTGLQVLAPAVEIKILRNTFAHNGLHTTQNMWADGLTVHDSEHGVFDNNTFIDNTDIDLIFGGCKSCKIRNNTVVHSSNAQGGAFVAIMIQKWPTTSGCYENVEISGNFIDCGPLRACGSGLYIGSESWYPQTPYGTLVDGQTSGIITKNSIKNTMNALYIAARGLAIYGNGFLNTHGMNIPNSCHKTMVSKTPIIVSPTAASCHFNLENVDPDMAKHYSSESWAGCIPNYPF